MYQVILEGEAYKKSFGTLFFGPLQQNYLFTWKTSLKAESSIRPIQSLQLQHDGPHETNCFLSLVVNKMTENAIFKGFY